MRRVASDLIICGSRLVHKLFNNTTCEIALLWTN